MPCDMRELGAVEVARPCPAKWSQMDGDDQVRFWERSDGTVITPDCPRRDFSAVRGAGSVFAALALIAMVLISIVGDDLRRLFSMAMGNMVAGSASSRTVDRRFDLLLDGDVGRDEAGLAAQLEELGGGALALDRIDLRDQHPGAFAREAPCDAAPDALAGTRHHRDPSLQARRPCRHARPLRSAFHRRGHLLVARSAGACPSPDRTPARRGRPRRNGTLADPSHSRAIRAKRLRSLTGGARVDDFEKLGTTVIGVSADNIETLDRFSLTECRSRFPVAADADARIMKSYDAVSTGRPDRASRTSYVISPAGQIVYAYTNPDFTDHTKNTMEAVQKLVGGQKK